MKRVITILLAIAVGGGAFSIVRGEDLPFNTMRRRAVRPPASLVRTPEILSVGLSCAKVVSVSNGAKLKGIIFFANGEERRDTQFHNGTLPNGNMPVYLWRSRGSGQKYCAVATLEFLPTDFNYFVDLQLEPMGFQPGDYVCTEIRPYHVSLEVLDGFGRIESWQFTNPDTSTRDTVYSVIHAGYVSFDVLYRTGDSTSINYDCN